MLRLPLPVRSAKQFAARVSTVEAHALRRCVHGDTLQVNTHTRRERDVEMNLQEDLTSRPDAALVMLAFLQADCTSPEYREELLALGQEINLTRDVSSSGPRGDLLVYGDLEPDGHLSSSVTASVDDLQPSVDLLRPGDQVDAAALHRVADGLRQIAAQLEHNVVAQATHNLSRNIQTSPIKEWKDHLSWEVGRVMRQGRYLSDLPQEQVFLALTLTLVKGVCEQRPLLLRNLFEAALQVVRRPRAR